MVNGELVMDIDSPTLDRGPPTLKAGAGAPVVNLGTLSTDEVAPKLNLGALSTDDGAEVTVRGVINLEIARAIGAEETDVP